jgi:XTP/dITP diphosphohydrolase
MRIVLATGNAKKRAELERILAGLDVELVPMTELGLEGADETGDTFTANALIKARAVVAAIGEAALADDSGLEVDALNGEPGVHSARYAGADGEDLSNNDKLMQELAGLPDEMRTARFVCVAALVTPDGEEWTVRGEMEGQITDEPHGEHGFGYDPYFIPAGCSVTTAELEPDEKDALSHRGKAFRAMRAHLEELLRDASSRSVRHHH